MSRGILWLDNTGQPVITHTANGERNATRWGWTRAVAVPEEELYAFTRWMVLQPQSDSRPPKTYDIVLWNDASEVVVDNLYYADAERIVEAHNRHLPDKIKIFIGRITGYNEHGSNTVEFDPPKEI